ncbi:hypothetical protein GMRT_15368 [Giardia muris]|uniref:Uncharacterized protein n=1 Tax=Giardia muris TaxID=5742 RepID=A0A4Z1TDV5_GIAMU|nr:hypothetical protein GMRT_15368 [Giardia muris]|eukprot:TNJ30721.1 hypothetical protein GMRT_15368 [Giardia muris]
MMEAFKQVKPDRVRLVRGVIAYRRWFVDRHGEQDPSPERVGRQFAVVQEQVGAILSRTESHELGYSDAVENLLVILTSSLFSYAMRFFTDDGRTTALFDSSLRLELAMQLWWLVSHTNKYIIDAALHPVYGNVAVQPMDLSTTMSMSLTEFEYRDTRITDGSTSRFYKEVLSMGNFLNCLVDASASLRLDKREVVKMCQICVMLDLDISALGITVSPVVIRRLVELGGSELPAIDMLTRLYFKLSGYRNSSDGLLQMILTFVQTSINLLFYESECEKSITASEKEGPEESLSYHKTFIDTLKHVHGMIINLRSTFSPRYIDSRMTNQIMQTFFENLVCIQALDPRLPMHIATLAHCIAYCRRNYTSAAHQILLYFTAGAEKGLTPSQANSWVSIADITNKMHQSIAKLRTDRIRQSTCGSGASLRQSGSISRSQLVSSTSSRIKESQMESIRVPDMRESPSFSASHARNDLALSVAGGGLEDSLQLPVVEMVQRSTTTLPTRVPGHVIPNGSGAAKDFLLSPNVSQTGQAGRTAGPDAYNFVPEQPYIGFILHHTEALAQLEQPLDNFLYAIDDQNNLQPLVELVEKGTLYHFQLYFPNLLKYLTVLTPTFYASSHHLSNLYRLVAACMQIQLALLELGSCMTTIELEQSVTSLITPISNVSNQLISSCASALPMLRRNARCYTKTTEELKAIRDGIGSFSPDRLELYMDIGRKSMTTTMRRQPLLYVIPGNLSKSVTDLFLESSVRTRASTASPVPDSSPLTQSDTIPLYHASSHNPMLFARDKSNSMQLGSLGKLDAHKLPVAMEQYRNYNYRFVYIKNIFLYFLLEAYLHLIRISFYVLQFHDPESDALVQRAQKGKPVEILQWISVQDVEDHDPWIEKGPLVPLPMGISRLHQFATAFRMRQDEGQARKKRKSRDSKSDLVGKMLTTGRYNETSETSVESSRTTDISAFVADNVPVPRISFVDGSRHRRVLTGLSVLIDAGANVLASLSLLDSSYVDFKYNYTQTDLVMESWPVPIGKLPCQFSLDDGAQTRHLVFINASHTWDYVYGITSHLLGKLERDFVFRRSASFASFGHLRGSESLISDSLQKLADTNARAICYVLGRREYDQVQGKKG